jgi:RNA polymerase sigma-70 factor (ECF subfamily)
MNGYSTMADQELMFHLQRGETSAFDELYKRYSKPLLGYFVRMLNYDKPKAQDALHDLFMKVIEKPNLFDTSKPFRTWIYTIAYNNCKNHYKHSEIVKEAHQELKHTEDLLDERFFISAAAKMDAKEFKKALLDVLATLSHDKKTTFILRYQEDKPIAEIAEIMDCSEGTVKSRIHYTIKILAEKLQIFNPEN